MSIMHPGSDSEILPERPPTGLQDGHMLMQMRAKIQNAITVVLNGLPRYRPVGRRYVHGLS